MCDRKTPGSRAVTRGLLVVLSSLALAAPAPATVLGCEEMDFANLHFTYGANHYRRSDTVLLYYSGLMSFLDAYIERRQAGGALEKKPFEITYHDFMGDSGPIIEIDQDADAYRVLSRDEADLNLRQLVRIIDYFASESWQPFPQGDPREPDSEYWEAYDRETAGFYKALETEVGEPDLSFFRHGEAVVLEVGELQVVYEVDRLRYVLAGEALDLDPADPVPVRVGDRLILGTEGAILVFEDGVEVTRQSTSSKDCIAEVGVRTDGESVEIGCEHTRWYRYSYAQNRFEEAEGRTDQHFYGYEFEDQNPEDDEFEHCLSYPTPVRVSLGPSRR